MYNRAFPVGNALFFFAGEMSLFRLPCGKFSLPFFAVPVSYTHLECRHFMGDDEISKELYYQSYYLCKVIEYQVGLEIVKKEAKEYLDLTLS